MDPFLEGGCGRPYSLVSLYRSYIITETMMIATMTTRTKIMAITIPAMAPPDGPPVREEGWWVKSRRSQLQLWVKMYVCVCLWIVYIHPNCILVLYKYILSIILCMTTYVHVWHSACLSLSVCEHIHSTTCVSAHAHTCTHACTQYSAPLPYTHMHTHIHLLIGTAVLVTERKGLDENTVYCLPTPDCLLARTPFCKGVVCQTTKPQIWQWFNYFN